MKNEAAAKKSTGSAGYVADRRQYSASGKRVGGGWAIVWKTDRGYEDGAIYRTKREAESALRVSVR